MEVTSALNPIDQWLGITRIESSAGTIHHMAPSAEHLGNPAIKALHGGVVTIFLERVAEIELTELRHSPTIAKIINTNIDFLRSAKLRDLYGTAEIAKLGRRLAVINVFAWQEDADSPVAKAAISLAL